MHISSIESYPVRIPLKPDHRMISALGRHDESQFVVVRVISDNGLEGAGEATATPRWSGETVWGVQSMIDNVLAPALLGIELNSEDPYGSIKALDARMDALAIHNWFAKSALEMACWDLLGKQAGKPVYDLLGGPCRSLIIPSRFSMGAYDLETARRRARELVALGFDTVKVKVGGEVQQDIARVRTVRKEIGPERKLVIDANCGWSADAAIHALHELRDCHVLIMEQPTPDGDYEAIAHVRRETGVKVMADDMCFNLTHARELLRNDACDLISVYPGKNGGIRKSREIVEFAARHDIGCTVGSNLEWDIATAAMGHLIVATPNLLVEEYPGDIHGPAYYEFGIAKNPLRVQGPETEITSRPGLGIDVDWDVVRGNPCS